jgi:hypothetical protein
MWLLRTVVSEEHVTSIRVKRISELGTTLKNAVFLDVSCVALVRTYVSVERIASIIRVTRRARNNVSSN